MAFVLRFSVWRFFRRVAGTASTKRTSSIAWRTRENAVVIEEVADDPVRYLVLGPDRSGNLLELVALDRPHGPAVIHAMKMRPKYRHLLPGSE